MYTVNLAFRYSQQDYARAMRSHYASRLRLPLDLTVVVVVAIAGVYEWRSGSNGLRILLLCMSGSFALMLLAAFTLVPIILFRSEPKFRDEYSLEFSASGIHFRTAHIESDLKWDLYTSALVDLHSYILYYGSRQFTVVPKRVFQDISQRQMFEQLLAQNVPRIVDKTK